MASNQRRARLRTVVPDHNAIVAVDPGRAAQTVVVADHDSPALGRTIARGTAHRRAAALEWAVRRPAEAGSGR